MEKNNCDKVTAALAALKNELMGIREQDVDLMKQLLKINDTLKSLSPKNNVNSVNKFPNSCPKHYGRTTPMTRRQRYHTYYLDKRRGSCDSSHGSLSSIEEFSNSAENCDIALDNDIDETSGSDGMLSCIQYSPEQSENYNFACSSSDEHLLISNIKVWKYKQSRSLEELQHVNNQMHIS